MLNLDTHILIYALGGELRPSERSLLDSDSWGISAIVLWEMAKLAQLGRISVSMDSGEFSRLFSRIHVWPVDLAVCLQSTRLDVSSDPADELIMATSVVHQVPLVTRDAKIRKSTMVPLARA